MYLSMYCPTLPLPGEVGAMYGALTEKVRPHIGDIVISVFVKDTIFSHVQITRLVHFCYSDLRHKPIAACFVSLL